MTNRGVRETRHECYCGYMTAWQQEDGLPFDIPMEKRKGIPPKKWNDNYDAVDAEWAAKHKGAPPFPGYGGGTKQHNFTPPVTPVIKNVVVVRSGPSLVDAWKGIMDGLTS
jgi:hypothetical protein